MNVKIDISKDVCDALLMKSGYVTEDAYVYFHNEIVPYGDVKLEKIGIRIAYRDGKRPSELDNEHPMLSNLKEYDYETVINRIFNEKLSNLLLN